MYQTNLLNNLLFQGLSCRNAKHQIGVYESFFIQLMLELIVNVKMSFNGFFATSCYKNNLSNASSYGFFHYFLNN